MGKTRDLFKQIRDTKGIFHAKMGTIKGRNSMDLTEAVPWTTRPGEGNGNPLQYPYLENSMHGGSWWATAHEGRKEWDMTE